VFGLPFVLESQDGPQCVRIGECSVGTPDRKHALPTVCNRENGRGNPTRARLVQLGFLGTNLFDERIYFRPKRLNRQAGLNIRLNSFSALAVTSPSCRLWYTTAGVFVDFPIPTRMNPELTIFTETGLLFLCHRVPDLNVSLDIAGIALGIEERTTFLRSAFQFWLSRNH